MHPGQITALTAALAATMITLVAYMSLMSGDPSKTFLKSTWHLTVNDDESDSGTPQTWYINTVDNVIKIVELDEESESVNVQEIHAGGVYEYSTADPNMDLTITAEEACDDVDLTDFDGDCESYRAKIQEGIESWSKVEIKDECSETLLTDDTISFAETLPCDGNAMVGGFMVSFAECTPTAILDKESGNVIATIDSIEDGIDESVTFSKCQDDNTDEDADTADRKLFNMKSPMSWAEWGIGWTDWCGGETNMVTAPCPGPKSWRTQGDFDANQACRRHDHGIVGAPSMHLVKLECQVDREAVQRSHNHALRAIFGHNGIARVSGCLNYKNNRRAKWTFSWITGWKRERKGWQWETRRGTNRMRGGHNDRTKMGHKIPGSHIRHPREKKQGEWDYERRTGKQWYYEWVPKDKIYKDRFRVCENDDAPQRSIVNDICWNCHSNNNWGP